MILKTLQLHPLLCHEWAWVLSYNNTKDAHNLLRFACDNGIHFFDTVNIYQCGESERGIATALHPYAKHLCIATKGGFRQDVPVSTSRKAITSH
jgi:aryl-alcohol dehydrogenase-like predicted oxidoreductase